MAKAEIILGESGGGSLTPTTLWENTDNITSSYTFVGQPVSLSNDINNYAYLKFTFIRRNTEPTNSSSVIFSVEDFVNFSTSATKFRGSICSNDGGGDPYSRYFWCKTNTQVEFNSGADTKNNIPMLIEGLK